ncbi:MAG TPA: RNA-binding cell elongation regulator Jag/EloR [Acidimicrobiales bacterium]|jgi:spoIIIJ-associated protein|nr:RNA-binding cell elongation regulator Jag/EloR [Acidimicrobiales bacterium]
MEWVEITDKTVEGATRRALDQLGVVETEAEIVVVEEPRTGLFGRVRGEARVRARIRPTGPRPKRARRGRSGRGGSTRPAEGGTNGRQGSTVAHGSDAPSGSKGSRSRSRGRRGGSHTREVATATVAVRQATESPQREDGAMAEGMTLEEQGAIGETFLQGLVAAFGLTATIEVRLLDEETVELAVDGADLGILVGPRGTTLAALQEVTRTAVQAKCPSRTDRILVDVARYRERRAQALTEFTQALAAEVVASGEERQMEPMSPADRKVIHDAATEIEGVATRSEGEDPDRFVVISPA